MSVEHIDHSKLDGVMEAYNTTGEKLDDQVTILEDEITQLDEDMQREVDRLSGTSGDDRLQLQASIAVFAEAAGTVEIVLIYAVNRAYWTAAYDIRVDTNTTETPVTLVYKAVVTQNTGEDWTDIPLTLETASPTFGVEVPTLNPWKLSVYTPRPPASNHQYFGAAVSRRGRGGFGAERQRERDRSNDTAEMAHQETQVTSKGNISATFRIPGAITIPSDGASHNFTIVQLKLDAVMKWVAVPKYDVRTHLKARVKNASEYVFLPGTASVYLDGSFISRSEVPAVSPMESFDCPLGLDPSVRITYHPLEQKLTQSGFYTKSNNHVYTQRITLHNTKSIPLSDLKLVDQVPVSEDAQIEVKLVSPALTLPSTAPSNGDTARMSLSSLSGASKILSSEAAVPTQIKAGQGILAHWDGADEPDADLDSLGKDGKLNWVVNVPAQSKVNLVMQWEVTTTTKVQIVGL